jgi:hypothetical protein
MDKFGKEESVQTFSVGKKMFERMKEQALGSPELRETIKELDQIQVITSKDTALTDEYYSSALVILSKAEGYDDVFSFDDENLQLIVKKKVAKGIVNELIVLLRSPEEFSLIEIIGKNINLKELAKYSVNMNFQILENLKKFEDKN